MERVPESIRFSKVSNITMSFYRIQIKVRHGISGTSDICVKYFRVRVRFSRTRPKPAFGRQGLDWIVGPEYSTHTEKPTWNHEKP